jgi:hypothetical protein
MENRVTLAGAERSQSLNGKRSQTALPPFRGCTNATG